MTAADLPGYAPFGQPGILLEDDEGAPFPEETQRLFREVAQEAYARGSRDHGHLSGAVRVGAGEHLVLMFDPPASRGALEAMRAHLRETWPDLADRILMVNGVKTVAVIEKGEPE